MNIGAAGQEYAELRRAGGVVAQTAGAFADVAAQKAAISDKAEEAQARADYELDLTTLGEELKIERDPNRYYATYAQKAAEIRKRYEDKLGAGAKALFAQRAPHAERVGLAAARKHSSGLYVEQQDGRRINSIDKIKQQAGMLDLADDLGMKKALRDADEVNENLRPLHGDAKTNENKIKDRQELLGVMAKRHKDVSPETFLEVGRTRYQGMDEKLYETYADQAERRVLEKRKAATVEFEKKQAAEEKEAQDNRQRELVAIDELIDAGKYTTADLTRAIEQRVITSTAERDHIYNRLMNPKTGKDRPSDPTVLRMVIGDVYDPRPTMTPDRIRQLMTRHAEGGPGLSIDDGKQALGQLTSSLTAAEALDRSKKNEAYTRALREGESALGLVTPMSQLDRTGDKLVSDFRAAFNAEVTDPNGQIVKNPREALYEILPIYQARQSADARLAYQDQAKIVGEATGSTPPDIMDKNWLQWFSQQQKANEANQTTNPNLYKLRMQQLLRLSRTRNEFINNEARRLMEAEKARAGGAGSTSKAGTSTTGGYSPPASR